MKNQWIGLVFVLGSFTLSAQTLDLETCLKMADTANLDIRNARLDVAMNKKQVAAYKSARLPQIAFAGDYKYNAIIPGQVVPADFFGGAPGTFATVKFGVPYNLGNTVQLTQVLYNPQVNYGLKALDLNQKVVEIQEKMTEQEVKQQVASTYFNFQAITKQLSFISTNLKNIEKLISNMEMMEKQGLVIATEVDKLRISKLNLVNSQQSLNATKDQLESLLKILIGLDVDTKITLVSDQLVQKSILGENLNVNRPEIELMDAQLELNREERKGTNMAYLPSLAFYAAYNYTYNMRPENDFRTGIEAAFVGLKLDWTLFDGFEKMNKQKVNAINNMKLENQKEQLAKQLDLQTSNALKQIEIQATALRISEEQLELSQKVYNQTQLQFNQGTVSSNDLITADNNLQQAQTNVVSAYVQLRQAELTYLKSIGNIK